MIARFGYFFILYGISFTGVECPVFKNLNNAQILNATNHYYYEDSITIACYPKHVFIGTDMKLSGGQSEVTKKCSGDGTWDGPDDIDCYSESS